MQNNMKKKLVTMGVMVIVILSVYFLAGIPFHWFPFHEKEFYPSPPTKLADEDYDIIWNITENLSMIVFNHSKGRAFGTSGEHAAKDIIKDAMSEIGLNPVEEPILPPHSQKLEILSTELFINDVNETEFFITPKWDWFVLKHIDGEYFGNRFDFLNYSDLTCEFEYHDLRVYPKGEIPWHEILNIDTIDKLFTETSIGNLSVLVESLLYKIEDTYGFNFSELNETNTPTLLSWIRNLTIFPHEIEGDFLFIDENPAFNPNISLPLLIRLAPLWSYNAGLFNYARNIAEMFIWKLIYPSCVGVILYDFNDDTYDMFHRNYYPLHTLLIKKNPGRDMYNNPQNYIINFSINQRWNESVESYNVIGEIPGSDQNKTFVVCSLYDSWWNQGTADSAIGMSMVLALANYFKKLEENGEKPRYNLKFIAFGGEEYGFRGAYSYEENAVENIDTVIDINQVGFYQNWPPLTLNLITNNQSLEKALQKIAKRTDYVNGLNDGTRFETHFVKQGAPSNDRPFAMSNRSCNTICFLKDKGSKNPQYRWILHHRDGMNHTEGDVFKYYYDEDVKLTTGMVLNVTYGLMFKEKAGLEVVIPFLITIIIIAVAVILIWKKEYLIEKFIKGSK